MVLLTPKFGFNSPKIKKRTIGSTLWASFLHLIFINKFGAQNWIFEAPIVEFVINFEVQEFQLLNKNQFFFEKCTTIPPTRVIDIIICRFLVMSGLKNVKKDLKDFL